MNSTWAELRKVDDGADGFKTEGKGEHCLQDSAGVDVAFLRVVCEEGRLVVESRVHTGKLPISKPLQAGKAQ